MSARPSAIALLFATAVLVPVPLARSAAPAIRVAVSDFQPGGATPEDQRSLGAGLQSMLTTDLAASSHITVVERARLADVRKELKLGHSAAADPATAAKLGRLAGASHLVTGTFTLVGNTLRLDARVIDVGTGRVALATDASGDKDTFFELEKKIAGAIISELGVTLTPKERASFARVQTADWQALRRFGDGLRLFEDADYDRALQALRDATERDREFKLAATTLESYERLVREIRSRAAVIEAEQDAKISLRGHDLRVQEQAVVDALSAVAARKEPGRPARLRRAVALYFMVRVLDDRNVEGVDRFARDRLLDAFVTRYVHEADGLFPDLPMVPEPVRGRHVAQVRIAYLGEDGDELVAPLRAAAPTLADTLRPMPFTESGSIAAEPRQPHGYHGTNATVSQLNDAMLDAIGEHAGPGAAAPPVLIIDRLGGALARTPETPGVGWDSSAEYVVRALSMVGDDGVTAIRRAHAKLFDALAPWTTGRLLPFVYGEHAPEEVAESVFSGADLRRLRELKQRYDAGNVFRAG